MPEFPECPNCKSDNIGRYDPLNPNFISNEGGEIEVYGDNKEFEKIREKLLEKSKEALDGALQHEETAKKLKRELENIKKEK